MAEKRTPGFACFGDSITSDQVTGIGTRVQQLLGFAMIGNFACGYATASDWHDGANNTTRITLVEPQDTNTNDNVLSNQVRRLLQQTSPEGAVIQWRHPIDGLFSIDPSIGRGTGQKQAPDVIYIAISTNDGNNVQNTLADDTEQVLAQSYRELTRNSLASALRWAVETLQSAYPLSQIFVATPLQAYSENPWMSYASTEKKRDIIVRVCRFLGVKVIDSFYESGFSRLIAKTNGEVHPNEEWKENIARYVAARILSAYYPG